MPPQPVLTRWGTWIEAAAFYASNFDMAKTFVDNLNCSTKKIAELKALMSTPSFKQQKISAAQFDRLPGFITSLEQLGLTMQSQLDILE